MYIVRTSDICMYHVCVCVFAAIMIMDNTEDWMGWPAVWRMWCGVVYWNVGHNIMRTSIQVLCFSRGTVYITTFQYPLYTVILYYLLTHSYGCVASYYCIWLIDWYRDRKMDGVRLMWNKGVPVAFTQRWNPFTSDVPYLTFTSHPLHRHPGTLIYIHTYICARYNYAYIHICYRMSKWQCPQCNVLSSRVQSHTDRLCGAATVC